MRALGRTEEIGGGGRLSSSGVCERGKSRGDAGGGRDSEDHKKVKKKRGKEANVRGGFFRLFRSSFSLSAALVRRD